MDERPSSATGRPRHAVEVIHGVRIPAGDSGGTLGAELFLPRDAGSVPALVTMHPYRNDALGGAGYRESLHWFASHGYGCVLVDFHGLGSSDGRARPPFDPAEGEDGAAVVHWAAGQPWCSGAVGMWGFSYGAAVALRTASRHPAPLKAITCVMGLADPERDFIHPAGARGCLAPLGVWGLGTLVNQLLPPLRDYHDPSEQRRWRDRVANAEPYLADLYRHPPAHPVWRSRAIDADGVTTPALCIGGWRDVFCDGSVRAYERLKGPAKLVMGPWTHTLPQDAPVEPVDFHTLALRWWDRWLAGIHNGVDDEPPVTVHVQGHDPHWRGLAAWPPAGECTGYVATPAGALELARHGGTGEVSATVPRDPTTGTRSGLWGIPTGGFGLPLDQHDDDLRGVAFTGPPLPDALLLMGRPSATVTLPASVDRARLVVKLTDVDPDGRSTLICGGVLDGAPATYQQVLLDPTGYRLPPGHRLRVTVSDSAFPRLWPVPDGPGGGSPLTVRGLTLSLPVVPEDHGDRVAVAALPARDGTASWVREEPRWEIHRDPLHNRVTVVVGDDLRATIPSSGVVLSQDTQLQATVRGDAPAGAGIRGESRVTLRLTTGEEVVARVDVLLHQEAATAIGQVTVDGVAVVCREWTVIAADSEDDDGRQGKRERTEPEDGGVTRDERVVTGQPLGNGLAGGHRGEHQQTDAAAQLAGGLVHGRGQPVAARDGGGAGADGDRLEAEPYSDHQQHSH
jgi:uncharacterized protein